MKNLQTFEEFLNESKDTKFFYKKGDQLTIDMGDGPEKVTVHSNIKAGAGRYDFITLSRSKGAPYTLSLGKLNKVLVNESVDTDVRFIVRLSANAAKSFESELKTNNIKYTKERPTVFFVEPTAKARMAIKLTKERFGNSNIIVESN